jgi:hypothetical protein
MADDKENVLDWYKRKQEEQKRKAQQRVKPSRRAMVYSNNEGKPIRKGDIEACKAQAEEQRKAQEAEAVLESVYSKPDLAVALEKK